MHDKNKNKAKKKKTITGPQIEDDCVYRCRCYKRPYTSMSINVPTCFEQHVIFQIGRKRVNYKC